MYIGYITVQQSLRIVMSTLSVISRQLAQYLPTRVNCMLHEVVATYTNTKVLSEICRTDRKCCARIISVNISEFRA